MTYLNLLAAVTTLASAIICAIFVASTITLKAGEGITLYNLIKDWQTVLAAAIALSGAYMTVISIRHQIDADNEREKQERIASANVYIAACRNYLMATCKAVEILNLTLDKRTLHSDDDLNFYYKSFLLVYREFPVILDDWAYLSKVPHDAMLLLKDAKICIKLIHDAIRDVRIIEKGTDILVRKAEWQDLCERIAPFVRQADSYILRAEEKMGRTSIHYHYPDVLATTENR